MNTDDNNLNKSVEFYSSFLSENQSSNRSELTFPKKTNHN